MARTRNKIFKIANLPLLREKREGKCLDVDLKMCGVDVMVSLIKTNL